MKQKDFFEIMDGATEQDITELMQNLRFRQIPPVQEENTMEQTNETRKKEIRMTKRGMITGSAVAAVLLVLNIGFGAHLLFGSNQQGELPSAINEGTPVFEAENVHATTTTQKTSSSDTLTFNLIPGDKADWISASENGLAHNVYRAQPGEEVRVDLTIKNDPGLCNFEIGLSFAALELLRYEDGDAYKGQYDQDYYDFNKQYDENALHLYGRGENMVAADDSVIRSFYFKVPEQCGQYTIKPRAANPLDRITHKDENGDQVEPSYIFYGLDVIVGDDVPMPDAATPVDYHADERKKYGEDTDNPYYVELAQLHYSDLSEIGDKTAIYVENTTAHAGDKNVPVRVCIKNNPGFDFAAFRIIPNERLSIKKEGTKDSKNIVVKVEPALNDAIFSGRESPYPLWGFSFLSLDAITADGTMFTFYVDIPDDAAVGKEFKLETRIVELSSEQCGQIYPLCTVGGVVRIVG